MLAQEHTLYLSDWTIHNPQQGQKVKANRGISLHHLHPEWLVLPPCCLDSQFQGLRSPEDCREMTRSKSTAFVECNASLTKHGEITTCLLKSKRIPGHCRPTMQACQRFPLMLSCHARPCWPAADGSATSNATAKANGCRCEYGGPRRTCAAETAYMW